MTEATVAAATLVEATWTATEAMASQEAMALMEVAEVAAPPEAGDAAALEASGHAASDGGLCSKVWEAWCTHDGLFIATVS